MTFASMHLFVAAKPVDGMTTKPKFSFGNPRQLSRSFVLAGSCFGSLQV